MIDWTKSMNQSFEFYKVDPITWGNVEQITTIIDCTIDNDSDADTLGSGSIESTTTFDEQYVRIYMIAEQDNATYKIPLATRLVQSPSSVFNGKYTKITSDAYTPLIELKENRPLLGYSVVKNKNIMDIAGTLCTENMRAPVIPVKNNEKLQLAFIAQTDDTWLSFLRDLISNADYKFAIDELGKVMFAPDQDINSLQPVWTFDDGNSSILYPEVTYDRDIYDIPNVVEVIYSSEGYYFTSRIVNNDPNSPVSIQNRGREIVYRETNPSSYNIVFQSQLNTYAEKLLKTLSSVECKITYKHGYCPVRIGDCVLLNYKAAGLNNVKAVVKTQSIKCVPGCPVTETATFISNLWR